MQSCRSRHSADGQLQRLLPPAYRAVIRHQPVESSQPQRQIEDAFDAQAELGLFVAEHLAAPALAAWLAVPFYGRFMPDEQRTACLEGFRAVLLWSWFLRSVCQTYALSAVRA